MKLALRTASLFAAAFLTLACPRANADEAKHSIQETAHRILVKVETAVEGGAKLASKGAQRGGKAVAFGIRRGAESTTRAIRRATRATGKGIRRVVGEIDGSHR